jgi:hypothetical protein
LRSLKRYARRKHRLVAAARAEGASAPYVETAPFIVIPSGRDFDRKRKPPYALPTDPAKSLRATDVIIHNKGFDDF